MIPLMKNTFLHEFETRRALADFILKSEKLSMDEYCRKFENKFSAIQGRKYAVLYNSGGSANIAMLQALKNLGKLKNNDKVGFSALTWSTNVMPIIQMGLNPIPIDCDPTTLNVMAENLIDRIKDEQLKMLFLTNVLGLVGDIDKIKGICKENNIILAEDNCESLGTETKFGKTGNFGLASTFSFFVAHHMSTIEGGMVCTDDDEMVQMLKIVRANGWDRNLSYKEKIKIRKHNKISSEFDAKYTFYDLGFNFRPTEITGFLGINQLQYLTENIKKREENYKKLELHTKKNGDLISLKHDHITKLSSFAFPVVCKNLKLRENYLSQFSGAGVEIRPMIAGNIQNQPFYRKYVKHNFELPGTQFLQENSFYCGNYPELTETDIETIGNCLVKY